MSATAPSRGWLVDIIVGGLAGGILGAIVAVNVVIFSGIERGYESGLGEIFEYHWLLGIATVMILAAGPVLGVMFARRWRKIRAARTGG